MKQNIVLEEVKKVSKTEMFVQKLKLAFLLFKSKKSIVFLVDDKGSYRVDRINISNEKSIDYTINYAENAVENQHINLSVKELIMNA